MNEVKKTSILQKTNSWKPFIDEVTSAVDAKDFRKQAISDILTIVDPQISMWPGSIWRYIKGLITGPGFVSGRIAMYEKPFELFLQKNLHTFDNAPVPAVKAFNRLVNSLFSTKIAKKLLLDENMARRHLTLREQALIQGEKARQSVYNRLIRIQEELSSPGPTEKAPPVAVAPEKKSLFSANSPFDVQSQKRIEQYLSSLNILDAATLQQFIAAIESALLAFHAELTAIQSDMATPELARYTDILSRIQTLTFFRAEESLFQEASCEAFQKKLTDSLSEKLSSIKTCLEEAKERTVALNDIEHKKNHLKNLIAPFARRKDLKNEVDLFLNQLAIIEVEDHVFQDKTSPQIALIIREHNARLDDLYKKIYTEFHQLLEKTTELDRSFDFFRLFMVAARFEIFSAQTPFPDLLPTINPIRTNLIKTMQMRRQSLISGQITLAEFSEELLSSLYDPDIKLIRGELTARSLRLKDLRNAFLEELLEIDQQNAFLRIAGITFSKNSPERRWLFDTFQKLQDPFLIFQDTYNPDSINVLFRFWWSDIERFRAEKQSRRRTFLSLIEKDASTLVRPIARLLDNLEKILSTKTPSIYTSFQASTKEKHHIDLISAINVWFNEQKDELITKFLLHLVPLDHADQSALLERIVVITSRKKDLLSFAQAIHAVKNFEPERIDSILEVFTIFPVMSSFDEPLLQSLQTLITKQEMALERIEAELIVELGLIDKRARMEAGYAFSRLIPLALLKIPTFLTNLAGELSTFKQDANPEVSFAASVLHRDTQDLIHIFPELGFDQEKLADAFRQVSVLFFQTQLLKASKKHSLFASTFIFLRMNEEIAKQAHSDELIGLARNLWDCFFPHVNNTILQETLHTFATRAESLLTTEKNKVVIKSGIDKVYREMSKNKLFKPPCPSFIPGDLRYFWEGLDAHEL